MSETPLAAEFRAALAKRAFMLTRVRPARGGCIEWTGNRHAKGYGIVRHENRLFLAHRLAYIFSHGEIPAGMVIDHLCRNRACVNPEHMEVVTPGENTRRGFGPSSLNRDKTHCIHGHSLADAYISRGYRECRTCKKARSKTRRDAIRAARHD